MISVTETGGEHEPFPNVMEEMKSVGMVNPIVLTPEWLERMGFKKTPIGMFTYSKDLPLYIQQASDLHYIPCAHGGQIGATLYYVHQLQNLYFALTDEELEIKRQA